LATADLRKTLISYSEPVLVYLDLNSFGKLWPKVLNFILRHENVFFGLLDPKKQVKDLVAYLHQGLVDYVPAARLNSEPNEKSLKKVLAYLKKYRSLPISSQLNNNKKNSIEYTPVLHGWQDIKPGAEYSFFIMYIELDDREDMEKRYDKKNLESALAVFQKYIERHVIPLGGRIWLWHGFGGIILFPFDPHENNSLLCGFKIVVYKYLHDVEESYFPNFISFRIALHLGNIIYQEANKGEVVSDSINSVFHLGQRFAETGQFYCTKEAFQYAPEPLKQFFKPCGSFEGRSIYRMKQIIFD